MAGLKVLAKTSHKNSIGADTFRLKSIRKQTKNSVRIDELFCNNLPLADDRSVAHYNLQDGSILETTSNPFWVACLYIKAAEVKQEQQGNPNNEDIQKWTIKSIPKKYTLIGLLLNSKKEFFKQPPHFPTLDDFVIYLEGLNKKGATMHPDYTQRDMRAFEREYSEDFVRKYDDPLTAFLDHHALRLGYLEPEEIDPTGRKLRPQIEIGDIGQTNNRGRHKQDRLCEDCEMAAAVVYCIDCPGGIALCQPCSQLLHSGARRRRHNIQDIRQAPKSKKPYVPRAFLAPFAITVAMYRSLTEGHLSLTEEEIKKIAQPLTDTDLMDKQNGRYVGGFDCMENMLIAKGLVKKEAARVPTFALTESGQILGEKLNTFYCHFNRFLQQHRFPKIPSSFVNKVAGNRKICLIIDEHERDKERLLAIAAESNIDAQVRFLPAGDYVWILSPPMMSTNEKYTGTDSHNELVLPFVVERKSWEDFENTLNSARFQRQINNMLGSGLKHCFYLMEGSLSALKSDTTHHHQQHLKAQVSKLTTEYGVYVNYTSSWMKSARWLLWFSQVIIKGYNLDIIGRTFKSCDAFGCEVEHLPHDLEAPYPRAGLYTEDCITYSDYASRVARQAGGTSPCIAFRNAGKVTHCWTSHLFIDHIFRDSQRERTLLDTVTQDLHVSDRKKHLLVIQDLEQYNKKRQSALNKCCELVCSNIQNGAEIVSDKIGQAIHNMVHYDIASFWQLYIQVIVGVYVVRTESQEDTGRVQQKFLTGPQGPIPNITKTKPVTPGRQKVAKQDRERPENKENIWTSTAKGPGENAESIRRAQVTRKNNIFTIGATASSDLDVNNSLTDQVYGKAYKTTKHPHHSKPKSSGIPLQLVTPFSGEGHCLGSGSYQNMMDHREDMYNFPLKEDQKPVFEGGLMGGALDRVDTDEKIEANSMSLKDEDFVNSQEEKAILQEVIAKSLKEKKPVNTEDEMYRLAVELSMKDAGKKSQTIGKDNKVPDTEEEQMKLALQRSMKESFGTESICLGSYEGSDKEVQIAIEKSKIDCKQNIERTETGSGIKRKCSFTEGSLPCTFPTQSAIDLDEEQQFNLAIALSRSSVHVNQDAIGSHVLKEREMFESKHQNVGDKKIVKLMDASGEEQLKMAIERSKVENYSPRKRMKSGSESRMRDTFLEHRKIPTRPINNVILIDSQSQDTDNESQSFDSCNKLSIKTEVPIINETLALNQQESDLDVKYNSVVCSDNFCGEKDRIKLTVERKINDKQFSVNERHTGNSTFFSDNNGLYDDANVFDDEGDDDDDCVPPSPDKLSQSFIPISSLDNVKLNLSGKVLKSVEKHIYKRSQNLTLSSKSMQTNPSGHARIIKQSLCDISAKYVTKKRTGLKESIFYDSDESSEASSEEEDNVDMKSIDECVGVVNGDKCAGVVSRSVDSYGQGYSHGSEEKHVDSRIIIPGNLYLTSAKSHSKLQKIGNDLERNNENKEEKDNENKDLVKKQNTIHRNQTSVTEDDSYICSLNHRNEVDYDDNLHDMDYQPNSQDFDSDSSNDERSDASFLSDLNGECLPVIGRPRGVRYRKIKTEIALLIKQKPTPKNDKTELAHSNMKIKSENGAIADNDSHSMFESDAQLAEILQNELNSEFHVTNNKPNTINDEQIAKELQERLDRGEENSVQKADTQENLENLGKKKIEELDTVYAMQLNVVLNGESKAQVDGDLSNVIQEKKMAVQVDLTESVHVDLTEPVKVDLTEDRDELVPELQRKELDKIEMWRRIILDDEKLAKQLQELEEMGQTDPDKNHEADIFHSNHQRMTNNQDTCFKKLVAKHKASREKALSQLNEYRQLQMLRFNMSKSESVTDHPSLLSQSLMSVHEHSTATSSKRDERVIYIDDEESNEYGVQNLTKTYRSPDVEWQTLLARHPPGQPHFPASSQMIDGDNASQSQIMSGCMNDIDLSSSALKNSNATGNMKDIDQPSSTIKNSNITCGNCGEKGHNRTYYLCKKYHTAEETARREAKLEKFRQQKEEKRKMEIETLSLLTNHQQVLEEMTEQIQTEMNTIQRRLKQKTSELEKHVSNRVKKLEKTKGKQKR